MKTTNRLGHRNNRRNKSNCKVTKTTPEIITNYTKTVFKDRLEILTDNNIPRDTYEKQKGIHEKYY